MRLAIIVGAVLLLPALLTWLLLRGIDTNAAAYADVLQSIDNFELAEASLRGDVLQARAGLLLDYDSLGRAEEAMEDAVARMQSHLQQQGLDATSVARLAAAVAQQEDLTERFKSDNSLRQNSLAYVGRLGADPALGALDAELASASRAVVTAILRLARDPLPDAARALQESIDRFAAQAPTDGPDAEAAKALVAHAALLSDLLPEVDRTLRALVAVPSKEPLEETRALFARTQAAVETTAQRFRLVLYLVSLLLLVAVVHLGAQLRRRTSALQRRAAFEHIIAENSTNLINRTASETVAEIKRVLGEFGKALGAQRAYAVLADAPSCVHAWSAGDEPYPRGWPAEALPLFEKLSGPEADNVRIIEVAGLPPGNARDRLTTAGIRAWMCIQVIRPGRTPGIIGFDMIRTTAGSSLPLYVLRLAAAVIANAIEREILDAQRQRTEIYLADAQRLSMTGSFGWTPSSGEICWSDETYRIFELDRTVKPTVELVLQHVHPDDRALVTQAIEDSSRGEKDLNLTHRLLMPDGRIKHVRVLSHAVQDARGNLEVVGALMDVTERQRAEVGLSRLAAIVSSSEDAIFSTTLDGEVTSWNAGATRLFGYEADEMIGQSFIRLVPHDRHELETQVLDRLRQGGSLNYETVRVTKNGRRVDVEVTVSPLLDRSGKLVGASRIVRDITEAKRAEAELREIRAELMRVARVTALGELTAAIAHEVNQPITGLLSSGNACLRWLAGDPPDLTAARRSVERIISDANRAGEVIGRIRAMVRKAPPQRDPLSINDTIMEVMALVLGEIRRNNVSAHAELANELPPVWGDRVQLQQVLLNLIMNAVEAMSGNGQTQRKLSISSKRDGLNDVVVEVKDSGVGLDAESMDRLFEAFYTTKADGLGMGLAVCQKIIQSHGGQLWATPNVPHGAVFHFRLPGRDEHA
jgi:PAS domain S-box-containing protein